MDFEEYKKKYTLKKRMAGPKGKKRPSFSVSLSRKYIDFFHMKEAYHQALLAMKRGEVPVGAVLTLKGKTLFAAGNEILERDSGLAHAELLLLKEAQKKYGRRLSDFTLYVTLEPCPMCAGAMVNCRLGRLVYGAPDPERGGCGSMLDVLSPKANLWKVQVTSGIMQEKCQKLLPSFFRKRRQE